MIELVPHSSRWREDFLSAAADLTPLGNAEWQVGHIGFTEVPALAAKPIIDLAVRIEDEADFQTHRPGLEAGGWRLG